MFDMRTLSNVDDLLLTGFVLNLTFSVIRSLPDYMLSKYQRKLKKLEDLIKQIKDWGGITSEHLDTLHMMHGVSYRATTETLDKLYDKWVPNIIFSSLVLLVTIFYSYCINSEILISTGFVYFVFFLSFFPVFLLFYISITSYSSYEQDYVFLNKNYNKLDNIINEAIDMKPQPDGTMEFSWDIEKIKNEINQTNWLSL